MSNHLNLPVKSKRNVLAKDEILMVTNADMLASANTATWPIQEEAEAKLSRFLKEEHSLRLVRAHDNSSAEGHGFINSQAYGAKVFSEMDENAPLIIFLTAWQYSHHIATSLNMHKGPILILANFDGRFPGLVGALNLTSTLNSLGVPHSRLWSIDFDDTFFKDKFSEWLNSGKIVHDLSYLKEVTSEDVQGATGADVGQYLGEYTLQHKSIMGLFDPYCMGMMNGVFPLKSLTDIGMPLESLSQSALLHEMSLVPPALSEECLNWYEDRGMQFEWSDDVEDGLTREQVLEQCAMMIAAARMGERFGCTAVGIQYQKGLKDSCAASDFAEGCLNNAERFPIPDEKGNIIRPGKPIPCINEVDMGSGIPQIMFYQILEALNLPSETTLHDIRWGSECNGEFYWDFEISGNVPFAHLKGGIAGAKGYRQAKLYFPKGGSTISGQCKAGTFIWARSHYEGLDVHLHVGTGKAFELPTEEFERRLNGTTDVWPLMNVQLDGVSRDELMAGHQSNHITVAYVPEDQLESVLQASLSMGLTLGMQVKKAGSIT